MLLENWEEAEVMQEENSGKMTLLISNQKTSIHFEMKSSEAMTLENKVSIWNIFILLKILLQEVAGKFNGSHLPIDTLSAEIYFTFY